jgi:hypothetical protein
MDIYENTGDIGFVKPSPERDTISGGLIVAQGAIIRVRGWPLFVTGWNGSSWQRVGLRGAAGTRL